MSLAERIASELDLVSQPMLQVCAWCDHESYGTRAADSRITHGVCTSCLRERLEQLHESGAQRHAGEKNQAALRFVADPPAKESEDVRASC